MRVFVDKLLYFFVLSPLSFLWERIYRLRRSLFHSGIFKTHTYRVPVVSVGNVTFGGTGKTPFTVWLAKWFCEKNVNPMILMRGYKGKLENAHGVLECGKEFGKSAADYGDEALLLSRKIPNGTIVVGKKRRENFEFYFDRFRPNVVLLDDGLQHLKINRNINLALFDALLPLHQYKTAPLGYLREGFQALKDCDVIILSRSDQTSDQKREDLKNLLRPHAKENVMIAEIGYKAVGIYHASFEKIMAIDEIKGRKVICLVALASPQSFFNLVEELGAQIVERITFPDHHNFELSEIESVLQKAEQNDAIILTSEKDIVKIKRFSLSDRILYIDIDIEFYSGQAQLESLLSKCVMS